MKKKLLVSILIAAAFLALAASAVDLKRFAEAFAEMRSGPLLPAVLILAAGQGFRVVRWWLLVRGIREVPLRRVAPIALVGFMAINVFPLRAGEVVRPLLLRGRESIPFGAGLATVIAERVVDAIAVFVMLAVSLLLVPSRQLSIAGASYDLEMIARTLLLLLVPAAAFLVLLVVLRQRLVSVVTRVLSLVHPTVATAAGHVLGTFVQGIEVLRAPAVAFGVSALTALIWGTQAVAMGLGFGAFGFDVPAMAAIPVLAVTMAGITIPAGIGMSGNFQVFCVAALALFQVDPARGLAYSLVMNVLMFAVALGMGLASLPFAEVRLGNLLSKLAGPGASSTEDRVADVAGKAGTSRT